MEHFQESTRTTPGSPPDPGQRQAMPYVFKCGRLMVLMLDSRGERDVFREDFPILGASQWQFINGVIDNLSDDVDALAIMTPTPIASMDPAGQSQKLLGNRTDDVDSFKKGDFHGLFNPHKPDRIIDKVGKFVTGPEVGEFSRLQSALT